MKRRKFLKYLAAGGVAATVTVVAGKFVWDILRKPLPPQDVIVIGGGLSGLTAAYLLTKEGKKVTVLEVSHRPGGRMGTWRWPNGQYNDVGTEEIFDVDTDALWLLNELGLDGKARRFEDSTTFFTRGQYVKPRSWYERGDLILGGNEKAKEDYRNLLDTVVDIVGPTYRGEEPWLHDYLGSHYLDYDHLSFKEWLLDEQGYDEDVDWLINLDYKSEFGTTTDEVSAGEGIESFYYIEMTDIFHLEGGNDQIITELVSRLPLGTVVVQAPVQKVANTTKGVEVQYGDGEVVEADAAIVAVPHTQALEIVEDLPSDKRIAMEKLIPTRLILPFQQYREKFWRTATNSWTGDFMLTDLNSSWIVNGTALQDEETFGPKGVLNHYVNQPEALALWSDQRKELGGTKGIHVEDAEAERITNAILDDMEQFWPNVRDYLEPPQTFPCEYKTGDSLKTSLVFEYEYYGPAFPPRYVLDGHYIKNREPFNRIFFACDWVYHFGADPAVASARNAVSQLLQI